jgi:hypothetical protein
VLQFFAMRSMFSGDAFHRAYTNATQQAFLEGHEHAFAYFGGLFRTLRLDFVPGNKIVVIWRAALCRRGSQACARIGLLGEMGPHNGSALAHDGLPFGISERRLSSSNVTSLSLQRSITSEERWLAPEIER